MTKFAFDPPHEEGYVYHGTTQERLADISSSKKLKTHRPWAGNADNWAPQHQWPDRSTEKRSYWSEHPEGTTAFIPGHDPAVIRGRAEHVKPKKESTGDLYATKPVPTKHLQHWNGKSWESV